MCLWGLAGCFLFVCLDALDFLSIGHAVLEVEELFPLLILLEDYDCTRVGNAVSTDVTWSYAEGLHLGICRHLWIYNSVYVFVYFMFREFQCKTGFCLPSIFTVVSRCFVSYFCIPAGFRHT